jgi:uncharacterized protein (DUF58 family)
MRISTHEAFHNIRRLQIKTARIVNSWLAGAYHSAFKGSGLEFAEVREYQSGDDVQDIDWHVTARMQRPYIKLFQEERELTVLLVVDISASTLFGSQARSKSAYMAEIGSILAFSALKNHDKVGLLLFSNEVELYLPPKRNLRHVLRVMRELLFFEPKHKGTDIKKALAFLGRVQKRSTICFVISDFLAGEFESEARLLAKRHDLIFINIFDQFEQQFPQLGHIEIRDLETDTQHLIDTSNPAVQHHFDSQTQQRQANLKQLTQRLKIELLSISGNESYLTVLQNFFKKRRQRR